MNEQTQIDLPVRKHLSHVPPVRVSQYAIGAPYFITICADRMHYGLVGRVVPIAPNPVSNDGSSCDADDAVARAQCERGAKPSTPQFSPTR